VFERGIMQNEQKILLEHLAKEDDMAYTILYEQFYVPMVLFAGKYIRDEEAAKDVVQEFFISMLGQKKRFENMIALKVYLYNSVKNRCFNYLRHERVREEYEAMVIREFDDVDLFWDRVMEEDVYVRVMHVVEELPQQYRNVMMLSLEGYKISEVAERMGIALDTAKEYKKEGKKRLGARLQALGMGMFVYVFL
jgi:RNA polymerase sigma factor, sigma-70 family